MYTYGISSENKENFKKLLILSFSVSFVITVPFVLLEWIKTGHPVYLYYGDYNAQQLAFYKHCIQMVQSGNWGWDWYTDMGSNFVGSYSYYMLGSPFFWIMCLFPSSWAPYLMGPMYMVKYIVAALTSYAYMQRFVKNKNYAIVGALLYSFCGFQIYNTFFNQFHDVVALFPLLLLGMEELINNERRGLFAVAVALNAMVNYFMFAGQVAFCIFYFIIRIYGRDFRITLKSFFLLAFEAVLGALMSMCVFLPGAMGLLGNTRVDRGFSEVLNMLVYMKNEQPYWYRYGHILESFFFPPDIPSRTNFFYGHSERWSSNAIYVPMFGLAGFFSFLQLKKTRTWLKVFVIFLCICCFVPLLNASFFLFNSSYYARWVYMLIAMMVLATIIALDNPASRWKGAILTYIAGAAAIFIPIGMRWYNDIETEKVDFKLGSAPYPERLWMCVGVVVISCIIMWWLFTRKRGRAAFDSAVIYSVCGIICLYSCIHITNGKQHSFSSDFMIDRALNGNVRLEDDEDFFRIDFYRDSNTSTLDNLGIYWHYPSIECFHTVVPSSIMEFYPKIGVTRSVGSRAETKLYGLRGLTSVKYSFIDEGKTSKHDTDGWVLDGNQAGFDIYRNENYIGMGFYYDEFMTESQFEKVTKSQRHALLCTYLVVPDDMAEYYSQFMTEVKFNGDGYTKPSYDRYVASVDERRQQTASNFEYSSGGFSADIRLDSPEVVFFSVPADKSTVTVAGHEIDLGGGWKVKVNGKEMPVLNVTYGFMAVECGAGDNHIEFTYSTPGLGVGMLLTLFGLAVLVVYLIISRRKGVKPTYSFFRDSFFSDERRQSEIDAELALAAGIKTEDVEVDVDVDVNVDVAVDVDAATDADAAADADCITVTEVEDFDAEAEDAATVSSYDEQTNDETENADLTEPSEEAPAEKSESKLGWWIASALFTAAVLAMTLAIIYFTYK